MSTLEDPLSAPCWIGYYRGNTDGHIYWEDGSYIEVPIAVYPGMVSWSQGDHSAITTAENGWVISKWRDMPLMKHKIEDSPYGSTGLKFYKSPSTSTIFGPSALCKQATCIIDNLPEGLRWSGAPARTASH